MYILLVLILLTLPWFINVGLALFTLSDEDPAKKYRSRGLCTSAGCIRCYRNQQELLQGINRFTKLFKNICTLERIKTALNASQESIKDLFLELNFQNTRPIWRHENWSNEMRRDLNKLSASTHSIIREFNEALKCAHLWRRNEEAEASWYTFSLINQGAWQEDQCRMCPNIMAILHSMDSLMRECAFGNVFISMLPQNAQIAEHRGVTNARLRAHFGLEVPSDQNTCYLIVSGEKLNWTVGSTVVFDDSYPHSVSSKNSKEDRIVLVLDLWNPQLSAQERDCLSQIFPHVYT